MVSSTQQKPPQRAKENERNDETSGKTLNETEVSDVSDEEFKTMIIKVLLNTGKEWAHTVITSNGSYRTKEYTRGVQQQTR